MEKVSGHRLFYEDFSSTVSVLDYQELILPKTNIPKAKRKNKNG